MRIFAYLFIVGLIFTSLNCEKGNLAGASQPLLHEVISQSGDSIGYTFFYYDNDRLVSVMDSNDRGNVYKSFFSYNSSGLAVSIRHIDNNDAAGTFHVSGEDSLIYDSNSRIIERRSLSQPSSIITYTYDASGRLISDNHNTFTYDNDDDVIKAILYSTGDTLTTASYDKKINPYTYDLGILSYIISNSPYDFMIFLSKHNISQMKTSNGRIANFVYEYNADDLPAKVNIHYNGFPDSVSFLTQFIY